MAKFKFQGIDTLVANYQKIGAMTDQMINRAVFEGAGVVADGIRKALESLPVDDEKWVKGRQRSSITSIQKEGLIDGLGIAPIRDDNGFVNVKVGFDGYNNNHRSRSYTGKHDYWDRLGQPNILIARSLENGTSYLKKNPIISKTTQSLKKACEEAMKKAFDDALQKDIDQ